MCIWLFQVIRSRLFPNKAASKPMWNTFPGVLAARPQFSMDPKDFPFYIRKLEVTDDKFTAVIHTTTSTVKESSALSRLIKNAAQSKFISKVKIHRLHCIIINSNYSNLCWMLLHSSYFAVWETLVVSNDTCTLKYLFKPLLPYKKCGCFTKINVVSVSSNVCFRKIAKCSINM